MANKFDDAIKLMNDMADKHESAGHYTESTIEEARSLMRFMIGESLKPQAAFDAMARLSSAITASANHHKALAAKAIADKETARAALVKATASRLAAEAFKNALGSGAGTFSMEVSNG